MEHLDEHSIPLTITTPQEDPVSLYFTPMLKQAVEYKRAVGYFTSGWIRANSEGLANLLKNNGRARWVTSPHLAEEDWSALQFSLSESERETMLQTFLDASIDELSQALESNVLNMLAWMIHDDILEFKIAIARDRNSGADFHTKYGVFRDQRGPVSAFIGSMNESARGLRNHETISIFMRSRPGEQQRIEDFDKRFDELWSNRDPSYMVYSLPDASAQKIINLRTQPRPYPPQKHTAASTFELRPYQVEAIQRWVDNNGHGLLEMATGTGKTITAIECVNAALRAPTPPKIIVVACPYKHLADQWLRELEIFEFPIIQAYETQSKWGPELYRLQVAFELEEAECGIILTTYDSLVKKRLSEFLENMGSGVMLVADECHHLGSQSRWDAMNPKFSWRLGLSATPERYFDDYGTKKLLDFFGGVVFEFGLEQAIENGYLTPYEYFPEFVYLNLEETEKYLVLSKRISREIAITDDEGSTGLERLLQMRARIIQNARAKIPWLLGHLESTAPGEWRHTLVYSGDEIFHEVTYLIGLQLGIRHHEFTAKQSRKDRTSILQRFDKGDLQILSAMKCLDEGIDVPATRTAFFLASSGNPREFVQRRGRILRKSPGKEKAKIFDAIAIPSPEILDSISGGEDRKVMRSALRSQLNRIQEFSELALNRIDAEKEVFKLRIELDLPIGL